MAKLTIPERYQEGVSMIRLLDDREVGEMRVALDRVLSGRTSEEDVASGKKLDEIASTAATSISHSHAKDLRKIGEAIAALYSVRSMRDVSAEQFADLVSDAMESLDSEQLRLPHAEREEFKKKLIELLGTELFAIAAKVADLRTDDERVFCHARIITDLRPVFGNSIEEGPKGMVVVHLLKIGYHRGSPNHQEFFVSLDSDDLQTLRKLIDRAEAKAISLKSAMKGTRLFGIAKE